MVFHLVSCGTLVSSNSFDVNSEEIHDRSVTMALAIKEILQDPYINQSNSLFISEKATSQSRNGLKSYEVPKKLLQFMSNQITIACAIDSIHNENTRFQNHLLIVDGYESLR